MIDTSIFNKNNISNEDIAKCKSQYENSDYVLCRMCPHFYMCTESAFITLTKILKSKESNNETT